MKETKPTEAQARFIRDLIAEMEKDFSVATVQRVASWRGWVATRVGTVGRHANGNLILVGWTFEIMLECLRINTPGGAA